MSEVKQRRLKNLGKLLEDLPLAGQPLSGALVGNQCHIHVHTLWKILRRCICRGVGIKKVCTGSEYRVMPQAHSTMALIDEYEMLG